MARARDPASETLRLLRARDAMDRDYARALDVEALARSVFLSRAHFTRSFRAAFGETPHRYLQRRRIERAMALLRETERPVSEVCLDVGFASLGTFSRTFRAVVGVPPSAYRERARRAPRPAVPACVAMAWDRPSTFGEAAARPVPAEPPGRRNPGSLGPQGRRKRSEETQVPSSTFGEARAGARA
jgi:AraC-like DNA-binding protein